MSKQGDSERLDGIVRAMEKAFGKGTVMRLGAGTEEEVPAIPTGSDSLDRALGVGGLPKGRVIEIFGQESSGKTTLALSAIARVQSEGGVAAFVDAEHALDPGYARTLGVNLDDLPVSQPDFGEQALQIVDAMVKTGDVDIVVLDSVAALVPKAELEGAMGESHMGLHARLMSQALRKLTPVAAKSGCTVIFINQIRQKIGVLFGSNETTTGGNALKFYASVRLEVKRAGQIKNGDEVIGSRVRVKVVKNKVAPPFGVAEFALMFGKGIDNQSELLDEALKAGVLRRSGAWYFFGDRQLGQGKNQVLKLFDDDPELVNEIREAINTSGEDGIAQIAFNKE